MLYKSSSNRSFTKDYYPTVDNTSYQCNLTESFSLYQRRLLSKAYDFQKESLDFEKLLSKVDNLFYKTVYSNCSFKKANERMISSIENKISELIDMIIIESNFSSEELTDEFNMEKWRNEFREKWSMEGPGDLRCMRFFLFLCGEGDIFKMLKADSLKLFECCCFGIGENNNLLNYLCWNEKGIFEELRKSSFKVRGDFETQMDNPITKSFEIKRTAKSILFRDKKEIVRKVYKCFKDASMQFDDDKYYYRDQISAELNEIKSKFRDLNRNRFPSTIYRKYLDHSAFYGKKMNDPSILDCESIASQFSKLTIELNDLYKKIANFKGDMLQIYSQTFFDICEETRNKLTKDNYFKSLGEIIQNLFEYKGRSDIWKSQGTASMLNTRQYNPIFKSTGKDFHPYSTADVPLFLDSVPMQKSQKIEFNKTMPEGFGGKAPQREKNELMDKIRDERKKDLEAIKEASNKKYESPETLKKSFFEESPLNEKEKNEDQLQTKNLKHNEVDKEKEIKENKDKVKEEEKRKEKEKSKEKEKEIYQLKPEKIPSPKINHNDYPMVEKLESEKEHEYQRDKIFSSDKKSRDKESPIYDFQKEEKSKFNETPHDIPKFEPKLSDKYISPKQELEFIDHQKDSNKFKIKDHLPKISSSESLSKKEHHYNQYEENIHQYSGRNPEQKIDIQSKELHQEEVFDDKFKNEYNYNDNDLGNADVKDVYEEKDYEFDHEEFDNVDNEIDNFDRKVDEFDDELEKDNQEFHEEKLYDRKQDDDLGFDENDNFDDFDADEDLQNEIHKEQNLNEKEDYEDDFNIDNEEFDDIEKEEFHEEPKKDYEPDFQDNFDDDDDIEFQDNKEKEIDFDDNDKDNFDDFKVEEDFDDEIQNDIKIDNGNKAFNDYNDDFEDSPGRDDEFEPVMKGIQKDNKFSSPVDNFLGQDDDEEGFEDFEYENELPGEKKMDDLNNANIDEDFNDEMGEDDEALMEQIRQSGLNNELEGDEAETQKLFGELQNFECINDYSKTSKFLKLRKVIVIDSYDIISIVFGEFVSQQKAFIFDYPETEALVQLGVKITQAEEHEDQQALEEFSQELEQLAQQIIQMIAESTGTEDINPGMRYFVPISDGMIEINPYLQRFIVHGNAGNEAEPLMGILTEIFNCENYLADEIRDDGQLSELNPYHAFYLRCFVNLYEKGPLDTLTMSYERPLFDRAEGVAKVCLDIAEKNTLEEILGKLDSKEVIGINIVVHEVGDLQEIPLVVQTAIEQNECIGCIVVGSSDEGPGIPFYFFLENSNFSVLFLSDGDETLAEHIISALASSAEGFGATFTIFEDFTRHGIILEAVTATLNVWASLVLKTKNKLNSLRNVIYSLIPYVEEAR